MRHGDDEWQLPKHQTGKTDREKSERTETNKYREFLSPHTSCRRGSLINDAKGKNMWKKNPNFQQDHYSV